MAPTLIERAFDLARNGECATMAEIQRRLSRESYEAVHQHLSGAATARQLRQLMRQNRTSAAALAEAQAA